MKEYKVIYEISGETWAIEMFEDMLKKFDDLSRISIKKLDNSKEE